MTRSQRSPHGDEADWQDLASSSDSFVVDDRFVQRTGLLVGDLFKGENTWSRVVVELRVLIAGREGGHHRSHG
jgi:hypothetical protein